MFIGSPPYLSYVGTYQKGLILGVLFCMWLDPLEFPSNVPLGGAFPLSVLRLWVAKERTGFFRVYLSMDQVINELIGQ